MLYCELRHIADIKLRRCAYIQKPRREELSHDVASSLIMLYTKYPEYTIRSFSRRIDIEIKDKITNGHKAHRKKGAAMLEMEDRSVSIESVPDLVCTEIEKEDEAIYLQDIINEDHGTQIILDIRWASNYTAAIETVRKYKTDQWIINNNHKLYHIYKIIRRKTNGKGINSGDAGPGSKRECTEKLQADRPIAVLGGKRITKGFQ